MIETAINTDEKLKDIPMNPWCIHSLGVDPAFGSSASALVLTEHLKEEDQIGVLYAEEFPDHPNPQDIVDKVFEIHRN